MSKVVPIPAARPGKPRVEFRHRLHENLPPDWEGLMWAAAVLVDGRLVGIARGVRASRRHDWSFYACRGSACSGWHVEGFTAAGLPSGLARLRQAIGEVFAAGRAAPVAANPVAAAMAADRAALVGSREPEAAA